MPLSLLPTTTVSRRNTLTPPVAIAASSAEVIRLDMEVFKESPPLNATAALPDEHGTPKPRYETSLVEGQSGGVTTSTLSRFTSAASLPLGGVSNPRRPSTAPLTPADVGAHQSTCANYLSDSESELWIAPADELEVTSKAAWDDDEGHDNNGPPTTHDLSPPPSPPDLGAPARNESALLSSRLATPGLILEGKPTTSSMPSVGMPRHPLPQGNKIIARPTTLDAVPPRDRIVLLAWGMAYGIVAVACSASGAMGLYLTSSEAVMALQAWAAACSMCLIVIEPLWIVLIVIVCGMTRALASDVSRFLRKEVH